MAVFDETAARALLEMLHAHLPVARAHGAGSADLAQRVAEELRLSDAAIGRCRAAALVHDIGMLGIGADVLVRPGPPSDADWNLLAAHPVLGERLLLAIPRLAELAPIVRAHHERIDGSGYPDRLRGAAIPLESRVIAVVDAFDAMTTSVPHRRCFTPDDAIGELLGNSGSQFDPDVVEAMAALFGRRARRLRLVSSA